MSYPDLKHKKIFFIKTLLLIPIRFVAEILQELIGVWAFIQRVVTTIFVYIVNPVALKDRISDPTIPPDLGDGSD